jgi:hypothetical protein
MNAKDAKVAVITSDMVERVARHKFVRIATERGLFQEKAWRKIPAVALPPQWLLHSPRWLILAVIASYPITRHRYPIASVQEIETLRAEVRAQTTLAEVVQMLEAGD